MELTRAIAEDLLVITGSMGSGKTTVLGEASDILSLREIQHACIDLDTLVMAHLPPQVSDDDVIYRNLKCVWENYGAHGLTRLLLASALESRTHLECCRAAVSAHRTVVCRLTASLHTMQQRVRVREPGTFQEKFARRAAELNSVLDNAHLEDFSVVNEDRSVTDVAREMLSRAGWL